MSSIRFQELLYPWLVIFGNTLECMMIKPTDIKKFIDPQAFVQQVVKAVTTKAVDSLLAAVPIVGENDYVFNPKDPYQGWKEGLLHWYPVGAERGNAGRIKLAGSAFNPIGERTVNCMESLIEM